jgi:hypothetical protein
MGLGEAGIAANSVYSQPSESNVNIPTERCPSESAFHRGSMRFGKANGRGLVALGVFLVILQFALISMPKTDRKASPSANPPVVAERKIIFLPSVLGGVCILIGATLILRSKADPTEAEAHRPIDSLLWTGSQSSGSLSWPGCCFWRRNGILRTSGLRTDGRIKTKVDVLR